LCDIQRLGIISALGTKNRKCILGCLHVVNENLHPDLPGGLVFKTLAVEPDTAGRQVQFRLAVDFI
jgi:hypothetical protein